MKVIIAIRKNNWSKAKKLINSKADITFKDPLDGWTALHWAVYRNRTDIVSILIKHGSDINAKTQSYKTPLYFAIGSFNYKCISILIKAGVNVNLKITESLVPLDYIKECIIYPYGVRMAKLLIDAGAKISTLDKNIAVACNSLNKTKRAILTTMGILKFRFKTCNKDMRNMIGMMVWESRFEEEWEEIWKN